MYNVLDIKKKLKETLGGIGCPRSIFTKISLASIPMD